MMQCHIFTPSRAALFTPELEQELGRHFDVTFHDRADAIAAVSDGAIVALDPDLFDWQFGPDKIDTLKSAKAIILQTTSFSWINTAHAAAKNIPVVNLRGFSTQSVAEYFLMMALALARKWPIVAQAGYKQDFTAHQGIELRGKTAGIIGLGRIGNRIADLMQGIGMDVCYYSKNTRSDKYRYLELDQLMETADVIFVCFAVNEETKKILDHRRLSLLKPSAILLTVLHNGFDHEFVIKQVQNGKLYGYGFEHDNATPTQHAGNILSLPALGWTTRECMAENARQWVEAMILAKDGKFPNRIN